MTTNGGITAYQTPSGVEKMSISVQKGPKQTKETKSLNVTLELAEPNVKTDKEQKEENEPKVNLNDNNTDRASKLGELKKMNSLMNEELYDNPNVEQKHRKNTNYT